MIAVDTNILVYAHREDSEWHEAAYARIAGLAEGRSSWALPWPCLHEFIAIATHPRIFSPPTPLLSAIDQVSAWIESPTIVLLAESELHWDAIRSLLEVGKVVGPQVHDARVAALCLQHGVRELWSADRDFGRFPGLTVTNPLVG
ncbi:MAG: TA system VapC family ribonuclease toxin [Chromatiales bacterium]